MCKYIFVCCIECIIFTQKIKLYTYEAIYYYRLQKTIFKSILSLELKIIIDLNFSEFAE